MVVESTGWAGINPGVVHQAGSNTALLVIDVQYSCMVLPQSR
jgi:hypothetical protein